MNKTRTVPALFVRWFWLVYLPIALLPLAVILRTFGILPGGTLMVMALGIWGLLALRLLIERRRKGLGVPLPKSMAIGLGSVAAMAAAGALLLILGMRKLTAGSGLTMTAIGGFLLLMSVTLPTFRLMDSLIRATTRFVKRLKGNRMEAH